MKVRARICKYEDFEVEVDEKYRPLSNDNFWSKNSSEANNLSHDLAWDVECEAGDDTDIIYIEDMNGYMLFEG